MDGSDSGFSLGGGSRSRVGRDRSRSRSPREWKRQERRSDRSNERRGGGGGRNDPHAKIRLLISNIPYETKWQPLKDMLREKLGGDIGYVELFQGPDGKNSGTGVIEVKGRELADKALKVLHRIDVNGREMVIREERDSDHSRMGGRGGGGGGGMMRGPPDGPDMRDMRGGMDMRGGPDMRGAGMASLLSGLGGGLGGGPGGGPGMGDLLSSSLNMGGFNLHSLCQLGIDIANITNQVFVANLDYKVTVQKLEEIFKIAGNVIEVDLKTDNDGKSRGKCTVRFEHPMEAVQAIYWTGLFNGQYLFDRQIGVRMDRWVDPIIQEIPRRLPIGLKGLGVGLGAGGQPVLNIGQIANTLTLSMLSGQLTGTGLMGGSGGAGLGGNVGGGGGLGLGGGLLNDSGLGGLSNLNNSNVTNLLGSMGSGGGLGGLSGLQGLGGGLGGGMGSLGGSGGGLSSGLGGSSLGGAGILGAGGLNGSSLSSIMGGASSGLGGLSSLDMALSSSRLGGGGGGALGGGLSDLRSGGGGGRLDVPGLMGLGAGFGDRGGPSGGGLGGLGMGLSFDKRLDDSMGGSNENCSVFVKNLPFNFTWQTLAEQFKDCGDIRFAEVKTENGRSKGMGVVQFFSPDAARRAILLMNGARLDGRHIEVRMDRLV